MAKAPKRRKTTSTNTATHNRQQTPTAVDENPKELYATPTATTKQRA